MTLDIVQVEKKLIEILSHYGIPVIMHSGYCQSLQYLCSDCEYNQGCYKLSKLYEMLMISGFLYRKLSETEEGILHSKLMQIIDEDETVF